MRLKEIREAKGITQRQAALDLNLSPTVYNRYEKGLRVQRKPPGDSTAENKSRNKKCTNVVNPSAVSQETKTADNWQRIWESNDGAII